MVIFSIIVLTVGFILIFLPSIFLCKENEGFSAYNDALQDGVASNLFLNSLLINAAICLPYALDILLDSCWNRGYNKSDRVQNSLVRLMPILIFGIPDTLMFVYKISPRFISQTLISQSIACLCYMTLSLRCDDLGVWNKRVTKHMIALITSIGVLAYYAETACVHSSPYYILMFLLYSITATFGLFYFTYHCYLWYRKYPGWNDQTPEQLFCLLYMVQLPLYISAQFLVWAIGSQLSPLTHFTARSLVGVVVLNIIVTTLGCVIPSVIFRSQIISMKTDADAKGKFMRYMAHEIRNPTSIVSSGLVILQDKILKEKTLLVEKARERGKEECERVAAYQNISIGMIESEMEIRDSSYSGSSSCSDRERGRDKSDLRDCENDWDLEKTREKGLEMERLKEMKGNSGTHIYGDGEDKVEDHGILHINSLSETIRDIKDANDIAIELLNVFLTYDKYKAGMLSIERKIIPTLPLIERCVKSYHFLAQQKGISLNLVFEPMTNNLMSLMDSSLFVDENKISQVFRNLLSNAMKFSKKGDKVTVSVFVSEALSSPTAAAVAKKEVARTQSKTIRWPAKHLYPPGGCRSSSNSSQFSSTFEINPAPIPIVPFRLNPSPQSPRDVFVHEGRTYSSRGYVRIEVTDTGPGISLDDQCKLFQEYVQLNPSLLQGGGGSGLGLNLSKAFVELHQGRIGVISEGLGKGATFFVELPIHGDDKGSILASQTSTAQRSGGTNSTNNNSVHIQHNNNHNSHNNNYISPINQNDLNHHRHVYNPNNNNNIINNNNTQAMRHTHLHHNQQDKNFTLLQAVVALLPKSATSSKSGKVHSESSDMYDNGNHSATPFGISMGSSFVSQMHSHKNTGIGLGAGAGSLSMYNGVSAYESLNGSVSVGSVAVSECESRTIGRNGSGNTLESDIHSQNHDTIYNDNHIRDIILNDNRDDDILIHHDITYQSTNNFYDNIGGNINSNIAGNIDNSGIITTPGPLSGSVPVMPDKNNPSNQYSLDSNRINSRNDIAVVVNNDHNSCYVGEGVLSVFKGMYDHTVSTAVSTDAHNTRALHTAADSPLAVSPHLAPPHRHSFCDFLSSTFSDFKFDRSAENVLTDHAHIQPPRKGSRPVYSEWDGDLTDMKFLLVDDSSMIRKVTSMLLLLKNSNNLCVECEDGDEAVSKVMEIMKEKETYERRKKSQKENQERERDIQIDLERRSLSSTTNDGPKIVACSDTTSVSVTASSCDDKVYDYVADLENSVRRGAGQGRGQADGQGGGLVKSSLDELIKTKSNRVIEMDGDTVRLRWRKGESSIANNDSIEPRYSDLESGVSKDHGPDPKEILDVEVQRKGTGTGTGTDLGPSRSNPGSWRRGDSILPFKSYTAILMDYEMNNMDGPKAIKTMRDLGYKGIIIGLTGHHGPEKYGEFMDSGANRVLSKPLNMDSLMTFLKEMKV